MFAVCRMELLLELRQQSGRGQGGDGGSNDRKGRERGQEEDITHVHTAVVMIPFSNLSSIRSRNLRIASKAQRLYLKTWDMPQDLKHAGRTPSVIT